MALLLTTDVGEVFVQPSDLVVTIDETGDTSLADPVHPVFGLGACAILALNYDQHQLPSVNRLLEPIMIVFLRVRRRDRRDVPADL